MPKEADGERIARLEARVEELSRRMDQSQSDRQDLHREFSNVSQKLKTQATFVGGIIFALTAIWAALGFAKEWIIAHLK